MIRVPPMVLSRGRSAWTNHMAHACVGQEKIVTVALCEARTRFEDLSLSSRQMCTCYMLCAGPWNGDGLGL